MSRQECLQEGKEFLAYLVANNIEAEKLPRSVFRQHHIEWRKLQSGRNRFSNVKYALMRAKLLRFDVNNCVHLLTPNRHLRRNYVVDQYISRRLSDIETTSNESEDEPSVEDRNTSNRKSKNDEPQPVIVRNADGCLFCNQCKMTFFEGELKDPEVHLKSERHRISVLILSVQNKSSTLGGKSIITITCNSSAGENGSQSVEVLKSTEAVVTFTAANISASESCTLQTWERPPVVDWNMQLFSRQTSLKPGETVEFEIRFTPQQVGEYHSFVTFNFKEDRTGKEFKVRGNFSISCVDDLVNTLSLGRSPVNRHYTQTPNFEPRAVEIVPGEKPPMIGRDNLDKQLKLNAYPLHSNLRSFINHGFKVTKTTKDEKTKSELLVLRQMLENGVCWPTYTKRFSTLLWCEEAQMDVDIKNYDMIGVTMKRKPRSSLVELEVPGLAENRPSVLKGDHLFVRIMGDGDKLDSIEYQGYVHDVHQLCVVLGFHKRLMEKFIDNMRFRVRFVNNRLPLRVQHRAVELAEEEILEDTLFPSEDTIGTVGYLQQPEQTLRFFSRSPAPNEEQARAIQHIVAGTSRPAPYIVFGPPGTGKTFTIVEAMKQVFSCFPNSRILACAPSNSAADLMAEKLCEHITNSDVIYRLNAVSRLKGSIPEKIKNICNLQNGEWEFPPKTDLEKKRIIVSTLITAGRLASANFTKGHFTHVFVDEASHATEPEVLVTIANLLDIKDNFKEGGQLVLAGDPKQLGPILRSPLVRKHKLDTSFMERLMESCGPYKRNQQEDDVYNSHVLTKLVRNYRSHPAILAPSNFLFYEGELQACANPVLSELMCGWEYLRQKNIPILFHAVLGEDMQEPNSPSFFNPQEVSILISYVEKLVNKKSPKGPVINEDHIGIISPYRKQVQKIRDALARKKITKIKVGSTEEFQGQERLIIIVSTVRSQPKFLETDLKFGLGFLTNPKRFNVAITRAKALLIVIGNPKILSCDPHWRHFINYCVEKKSTCGEKIHIDDNDDELKKYADMLSELTIDDADPTEASAQNIEEEWRREP